MFTGIIRSVQPLVSLQQKDDNTIFTIQKPEAWRIEIGESIAINGVCSTVITQTDDTFDVEYMPETLRLTTMGNMQQGAMLNLERSMRPDDLLSGYIVSGHVEGMGTIVSIEDDGKNSHIIRIQYPKEARKYFIHKGGVTIDGVALTVIDPSDTEFSVAIIPHSWKHTAMHTWQPGTRVNLEYDLIAKYVERMMGARAE